MVQIQYEGKVSLVDAKSLDILMNYSESYSNPIVIFDDGTHTNVSLEDANKLLLNAGPRPEITTSSGDIRIDVNSINKIEINGDGTCNIYTDSGNNFLINDSELYKIIKSLDENNGHGADYGYSDSVRAVPGSEGWLYDIEYSGLDYDYAYKYFSNRMSGAVLGLCTSVWKKTGTSMNVFGHAYDWTYDDLVTFRVRTKCGDGHKGTMGTASSLPWFTKQAMQEHENLVEYKLIPFYMVDGINEDHVWMTTNQVPTEDKGRTTGTNPSAEDSVCNLMVLRYVLDRAESADDAKEILKNINIYAPNTEKGGLMDLEVHWLFGDRNKAYLLEIINNKLVFTELSVDAIHHMTNFFLDTENTSNPTLDPEGKCDYNNITRFGQGLERFDNIVDHYSEIDGASKLNTLLLQYAKYTDCYRVGNDRFTDFTGDWSSIGEGILTVKDAKEDPSKFENVLTRQMELFNNRTRDDYKENKITSQSVHIVGYDIEKLRMYISVQEATAQYIFDFDNYYTKSEVEKKIEEGGGGGGTSYSAGPGIIINNKVISLDNTISNLTNYYTKNQTYDKAKIDELVAGKVVFVTVDVLPEASKDTMNKIYLVPAKNPSSENAKDEYITIDKGIGVSPRYIWECIGSTGVDLSNYYNKQQTDAKISEATVNKADKATSLSGYGITDAKIEGNKITLGADSINVQTALTQAANAGKNITISDDYKISVENIPWSDVTSTPTTLDGYGITDAVKSVNKVTPDSAGNVDVTTFMPVPASMNPYKTGTVENFCKQFLTIVNPVQGSAYLTGGIGFSNLPKSFYDHSNYPSCELYIYVPVRSGNNVVFNLEITTTNCFDEQWYGGPGKWMAICQVENGSATLHMPWKGVLTCPQTDELIGGKHKYIPASDSDGASKYYVDLQDSKKQDTLISSGSYQNIKTINGEDILGKGDIQISGGGVTKEYVDTTFTTYSYVDANYIKITDLQNEFKVVFGAPSIESSDLKPYDSSKNYVLNEYFLSETGYLLRFTEPHTAGTPLDPSSYVKTSLLHDLATILTGNSYMIG